MDRRSSSSSDWSNSAQYEPYRHFEESESPPQSPPRAPPLPPRTPSCSRDGAVELPGSSQNIMSAERLETMYKCMECPVCRMIRRGKILSCSLGHHVCESCFIRLKEKDMTCPLGRCEYGDVPPRNYICENIIESSNIQFPCTYRGCQTTGDVTMLNIHEKNCRWKPFNCPARENCNVPRKSIATHFLWCHDFKSGPEAELVLGILNNKFKYIKPALMKADDGKLFFVTLMHNETNEGRIVVLADLDDQRYEGCSCEITMSSPQREFVYKGRIHDLEAKAADIIKVKEGILLTAKENKKNTIAGLEDYVTLKLKCKLV